MKVRLELDVHPSEAVRVASLVSALRDFVAVLSTYSASPDNTDIPNPAPTANLTPSPTSALSVDSSDPDHDCPASTSFTPSQPNPNPSPAPTVSAANPAPSTSNHALPQGLPASPPAVKPASVKPLTSLNHPSFPSAHLSEPASLSSPTSSHVEPSASEKPHPSISVELEGLISANLAAATELASSSPVLDPSLVSEDVPPTPKQTQARPRQQTREPKPRNGLRSTSRKTSTASSAATSLPGNRKPRSGSPNPEGTKRRTDESISSSLTRRGRRNTRPTNGKGGPAASATTANGGGGSTSSNGNTNSFSKQNGRRRPPIVAITTPQGLFQAVAVASISVKRAVSDLQGMLSKKTNPLSQDDLVRAATAEIVDPGKVCNHPSRGLNIVRVFIGLGETHLTAFTQYFMSEAIKEFVKDRDSGCNRAEFLGYSDGFAALVQEDSISADSALKMIWRLLRSEVCQTAGVTTLCKLAESCNGMLAQKCLNQELLENVKDKLTELAKKNEFVYDITYLNGAMNWTIPVPQ